MKIAVRVSIIASPQACSSFARMLLTPADFPFFGDFISSCKIALFRNAVGSPLVWWLYSTEQTYSVHQLIITLSSVRPFPYLSWIMLILPFLSLVRLLTIWNDFVLLFLFMLSSIVLHCSLITFSWLLSCFCWFLYTFQLLRDCSYLTFFSSLILPHMLSRLLVIHSFVFLMIFTKNLAKSLCLLPLGWQEVQITHLSLLGMLLQLQCFSTSQSLT